MVAKCKIIVTDTKHFIDSNMQCFQHEGWKPDDNMATLEPEIENQY